METAELQVMESDKNGRVEPNKERTLCRWKKKGKSIRELVGRLHG